MASCSSSLIFFLLCYPRGKKTLFQTCSEIPSTWITLWLVKSFVYPQTNHHDQWGHGHHDQLKTCKFLIGQLSTGVARESVLVCLGCNNRVEKEQNFFSSQFGRLGRPRSRCQQGHCLVRVWYLLPRRRLETASSRVEEHRVQKQRQKCTSSSQQALLQRQLHLIHGSGGSSQDLILPKNPSYKYDHISH
jgi:hypothetical protein